MRESYLGRADLPSTGLATQLQRYLRNLGETRGGHRMAAAQETTRDIHRHASTSSGRT